MSSSSSSSRMVVEDEVSVATAFNLQEIRGGTFKKGVGYGYLREEEGTVVVIGRLNGRTAARKE